MCIPEGGRREQEVAHGESARNHAGACARLDAGPVSAHRGPAVTRRDVGACLTATFPTRRIRPGRLVSSLAILSRSQSCFSSCFQYFTARVSKWSLASSPRLFGCSRSSVSWPQSGTSSGIGRRGASSRHVQPARRPDPDDMDGRGQGATGRNACAMERPQPSAFADLNLSPCGQEEIAARAMCIIDAASDNRVNSLGCSGELWGALECSYCYG